MTFQLPTVNIVDHLDREGVINLLSFDNFAFLLFGAVVGREDFNHTSLYCLIVGNLYRYDFFPYPFLHIHNCEHALFYPLFEEVLIRVSAETFRFAWAFGDRIKWHPADLKS